MDPVTISDQDFHDLISKRARTLLGLVSYLSERPSIREILTRPLLGELLSQSMQMEELLDAYDARNNCQWCYFRSLVATAKLFSDVSYELLHIEHSLPAYRLLPIEHDFVKATEYALSFTGDMLMQAGKRMVERAGELQLPIPTEHEREKSYVEHLPPGRLPHDCGTRRTETVGETVTLLATAFLNLAADSKDVRAASRATPEEYKLCLASSVTEERLRRLELRFHSLQSQYDTYVSGTEAELADEDLPVLRGHVSVVFHLLTVATLLAHYYERHVNKELCAMAAERKALVEADALLGVLMKYAILHIGLYIACAEHLCQEMLKRYTEQDSIEVPVPRYRGFHVRPSTLISKLVLHYGSGVRMYLAEEVYDAGSALELFRANERINAQKRRWLASEIVRLQLVPSRADPSQICDTLRKVVARLAEGGKLIRYEKPRQLPEQIDQEAGTVLERVLEVMAGLLALGKIDIGTDLKARFVGDRRVLADIKLLAECGYGEDNLGNNIPLPDKLRYLRK